MFQSRILHTTNFRLVRSVSTTTNVNNRYKPWPPEKFRRIGRRPAYWTGQLGGPRSRIPYDKRYPLSGKDINVTTEGLRRGGNEVMGKWIGEERAKYNSAVISYYDYVKDREITEIVPEMIPEFVVPDLTDFSVAVLVMKLFFSNIGITVECGLKPYVSYRVSDDVRVQPKHTAEQLFSETYQKSDS